MPWAEPVLVPRGLRLGNCTSQGWAHTEMKPLLSQHKKGAASRSSFQSCAPGVRMGSPLHGLAFTLPWKVTWSSSKRGALQIILNGSPLKEIQCSLRRPDVNSVTLELPDPGPH